MTMALNKNCINHMNQIQEIVKTRLFLAYWKEAIGNLDFTFFDNGTSLKEALLPLDLKPNFSMINQIIDRLSDGDRLFLNALLCFYDAKFVSKQTIIQIARIDEKRKILLMRLFENFLPTHFEEIK